MGYEIQRVYSYNGDKPAVLVDRLWPRGVSKTKLSEVTWLKEIAPSTALREWFHQDRTNRFTEFCHRYEQELQQPSMQNALTSLRQTEQKQGKLILLTAAKAIDHCHLPTLLKVLKSK
ncbi:DUF488 family protein [Orbaceae bacterium ESL0727]|nr:DUF488 family protein [Orbaceae bacterium ESL0727]